LERGAVNPALAGNIPQGGFKGPTNPSGCPAGMPFAEERTTPTTSMGTQPVPNPALTANLADHNETIPFATNIRNVQHNEIQMMAAWLRVWFGTTAGMGHGGAMGS
jgi:hypothetical protein